MRVGIAKNWEWPDLFRQTPKGSGAFDGVHFVACPSGEPIDWLVSLNNRFNAPVSVQVPANRVVALMQEPFVPGFTDWMDRGLDAFSLVLSSHRPSRCRQWEATHPAVAWHVNRSFDQLVAMQVPDKPRLASWICGGARALPGHRDRLSFLKRLQGNARVPVDLFGRATTPIDDKWDGLAPYMYSLAVENTVAEDYWTEKVADCFLSWTCPIYHGAPNLSKYFPPESFIRIDIRRPREALETVREVLAGGDREWRNRREAIAEARELVLHRWQLFPYLAQRLARAADAPGPSCTVTIPAYRKSLRSSLRRRAQRWKGILVRMGRALT